MKFIYIVIGFLILTTACITEENPKPSFPKSFKFDTYIIDGDIETFNSFGMPILTESKNSKEDLFFEPIFGGYFRELPLNRIDLISSNEAIFIFSNTDSTYSKEGVYTIKSGKLEMEVFFGHRVLGSLFFSCDYAVENQLSINAFGYKLYGPLMNGITREETGGRYGEINFNEILKRTEVSDTLQVQKYRKVYNLTD